MWEGYRREEASWVASEDITESAVRLAFLVNLTVFISILLLSLDHFMRLNPLIVS